LFSVATIHKYTRKAVWQGERTEEDCVLHCCGQGW